jgi:hypothetical protein
MGESSDSASASVLALLRQRKRPAAKIAATSRRRWSGAISTRQDPCSIGIVPNAPRNSVLLGHLRRVRKDCPAFGRKETPGEPLERKDLERRRESAARIRYITTAWGLAPG